MVVGVDVCASRKKFGCVRLMWEARSVLLIATPLPEVPRLVRMRGKLDLVEENVEYL